MYRPTLARTGTAYPFGYGRQWRLCACWAGAGKGPGAGCEDEACGWGSSLRLFSSRPAAGPSGLLGAGIVPGMPGAADHAVQAAQELGVVIRPYGASAYCGPCRLRGVAGEWLPDQAAQPGVPGLPAPGVASRAMVPCASQLIPAGTRAQRPIAA